MKKHPLFTIALTVCLLAFLGFATLAFLEFGNFQEARERHQRLETSLVAAQSLDPAPTPENLAAAKQNLDELLAALEQQIDLSSGSRNLVADSPAPANGSDMLFKLSEYRQTFVNAAARVAPMFSSMKADGTPEQPLRLPDDFAFGFSSYLDDGTPPLDSHVPVLHQQKEILTYILRRLYEARPIAVTEIKREPAAQVLARRGEAEVAAEGSANADSRRRRRGPDDEFSLGDVSLRVPGAVETLAFSLTFEGYTQSLRPFLRSLEAYELPLVVRKIQVEPVTDAMQDAAAQNEPQDAASALEALFGPSATETAEPEPPQPESPTIEVVTQNISRFTVVIEYIEVLLEPTAEPVGGPEIAFDGE